MTLTGAELITGFLERRGTPVVAGIPGGAVLPLYRALAGTTIRQIDEHRPQRPGSKGAAVCIVESGPRLASLVATLARARVVCVVGQVRRALVGSSACPDTRRLVAPIAKACFHVGAAYELMDLLPRAFQIAESGRPGPVVLDIPVDVQAEAAPGARVPAPPSRPRAMARTIFLTMETCA